MDKSTLRKAALPAPRRRRHLAASGSAARPVSARFVAVVGHEIRTPLAAALVYMNIAEHDLVAGSPGGPAYHALATARAEILRADRLVGRVIELEQLGHAVIRPQLIDAAKVVRQTVQRATLGARGVEVLLDPAPAALLGRWDDAALEQIVHNLLSNALKFGCGRPIQIALTAAGGTLRLAVRDRGIGIRIADQQRIFGRAVRNPAERSGGLGLGLWLVRQLCTAHGGDVSVRSRPGQGATFAITLREAPLSGTRTARVTAPIALHVAAARRRGAHPAARRSAPPH